MSDAISISGLDEALRDLDALPLHIVQECFPDALAAGGAVIEQELDARTPEGDVSTSSKTYGSLRADLSTTVEVNPESLSGSAKTGFGIKGFVARMVEYGHREVTHAGKEVGSVKSHPFMRTAAEASAAGAIEAFEESLDSLNR